MSSVRNREMSPPDARSERQDSLYADAAEAHGGMIARLSAGYEADPSQREDLEQEIHFQLWRSFASFAAQCSIATWVHRIAHNVGARHVHRAVRSKPGAFVDLDGIEIADARGGPDESADTAATLDRLYALIWRLRPIDRQVLLLHLEEMDAAACAEITGLTPGAVTTRIHRIKALLARQFAEGHRP